VGRPLARLAAAAAATYASPGLAAIGGLRYPGVVRRVPERAGAVALTFDDGPHPEGTPAVLAELEGLGMRATFYVVATQARRHPGLLRDVVATGHELGLHGGRHLPHALMPPFLLERELHRARAEIEALAGVELRTLRAPFGAVSLSTLRFASQSRMRVVGWSRWGRDWEPRATPAAIARRVAGGAEDGDILLLHDSDAYSAAGSWRRTVDALPEIAELLGASGLGVVTVGELLGG
jgi:peptidoglycan/xylan/chitin deacetylase (PgdA/CDA1 family)